MISEEGGAGGRGPLCVLTEDSDHGQTSSPVLKDSTNDVTHFMLSNVRQLARHSVPG